MEKKPYVEFRVASYALLDAIRGIQNSSKKDCYDEIIVTKEDSNLVVRVFRSYVPVDQNTSCCNGGSD